MNQGCHGAVVEMHGTSSISHWVETGLVVSGVEPTSMRSILSWTMRSFATSAARFGFDWLSFTTTSTGTVALPTLMPALVASLKLLMMKLSASAKAASGPVYGETYPSLTGRVCAIAGDFNPTDSMAPEAAEYFSSVRRSIARR